MRVSDSTVTATLSGNLSRNFQKISQLQNQLTSGMRINNASDDPAAARQALNLSAQVRNVEQYQRNIQTGQGYMDITDSMLGGIVETLTSAKTTAIQGANATLTAQDRKTLAQTIDSDLEHVLQLSATQFQGHYIFGGTNTLVRPYVETRDAAGKIATVENGLTDGRTMSDSTTAVGTLLNLGSPPSGTVTVGDKTVTIDLATDSLTAIKAKIDAAAPTGVTTSIVATSSSGGGTTSRLVISGTTTISDSNNVLGTLGIHTVDTTGSVLREIGDGVNVAINASGKDVFEGQNNPFTAMLNLRDSLNTNDLQGIQNSITALDQAQKRASDVRAVMGARSSRVTMTNNLLDQVNVNLKSSLSDTQDTDFTQTVVDLQKFQNTFQASLSTGLNLIQPSLLTFLR